MLFQCCSKLAETANLSTSITNHKYLLRRRLLKILLISNYTSLDDLLITGCQISVIA